MPASTSIHVQVNAELESAAGVGAAGFGVPMVIAESDSVSAGSRLHGPFTSAADVVDFGYEEGSPQHSAAVSIFSQSPRARSMYIGRRDGTDADDGEAFTEILAANPGAWYGCTSVLRDVTEALALRSAIEAAAYPKIGIVQSNDASLLAGTGQAWTATFGGTVADGTITLTFTGYGLPSPVVVTTTRAAGSPATIALMLAALDTALDTAAAGSLDDVLVPSSISSTATTVSLAIVDGLPTGTVTVGGTATNVAPAVATITASIALTDGDIGSRFFDLQGFRCALLYYHSDSVYADAAMLSNGLAFNLDTRKGIWAYQSLLSVEGSPLTDLQRTALRAVNCNYFAPGITSAGQVTRSFTAQGWMPNGLTAAGRRIDVTTTIDWARARLEEALLNVMLTARHGVPMTAAGINSYASAAMGVLQDGIAAGHFTSFTVPSDDLYYPDVTTPAIFPPDVRDMTPAERAARAVTLPAVAYITPFVERVTFDLNARQ
jgi:hypothetical protein